MARLRGEDGFTLPELLVTMLILGLVVVPIGTAIFVGIRTETDVQDRLSQTNGAHLLNSYFTPDVQNALAVSIGGSESSLICGATAHASALVLTTEVNEHSISYFVDPANNRILRRRECAAGAPVGPAEGIGLARNLNSAHPPVFACAPSPDCVNWSSVSVAVNQIGTAGRNAYPTALEATRRAR